MQYPSEQGNLLPSALHKIFSKLDGLNVLMAPHIYMKEPNMQEVTRLRKAFDAGEEVNLRDTDAHCVCALLVVFFSVCPEPLIPIECYDMLVRYYTNEKLLKMTMDKLQSENRHTLYRLLAHIADVGACSNYNQVPLDRVIRTFSRFIMRPDNVFNPEKDQPSEEEAKTVVQFLEMLISRRDELLKPPREERSMTDEFVHLHADFVGALINEQYTMGGVRLTDTHIHWRPNVPLSPRGTNACLIPFSNVFKVELFGAAKKELLKALPSTHFVVSYTSTLPPSPRAVVMGNRNSATPMPPPDQVKTLTLGFEDLPTCKLVYTYILGMIKNSNVASTALRSPPFRYDLYGMGLMSLPASLCRQLITTQEINMGRNSFSTFPSDVMWAENLKILNLEENQLTSISPETVQYMGQRMHSLEVIGLSGNMLTTLPPLAPLTRLRTLNISSNKITSLPEDILLLPNLEVLTATHNQLTDLPPLILPVSPLRTLDLRSNRFKTVPNVISSMKLLTVANFSHNNISTLPVSLFTLPALSELKLDNNELVSIPPDIKCMTNLRRLSLDTNQITKLPIGIGEMRSLMELRVGNNKLTSLPMTLLSLNKLVTLEVEGNNLEGLPIDVIKRGRESILDVLKGKMSSLMPCSRYRIVMFGEKKGGKTALISQLKRSSTTPVPSTPPSPLASSTGLTIHEWTTVMNVTQEGKKVREGTFHIWEFSERDMAHEIHPMFLTENCIPIVVWNMADGDERYVAHCLNSVSQLGKLNHPVIVVGTHTDDPSCSKKIVTETLDKMAKKFKELFPKLSISLHAVNCLKVDSGSVKKLRKHITHIASNYLLSSPSVPASYFLFEEYMREMVTVSQSQFLTATKLRRISKMFGLKSEFAQVRNVFRNLGSLYFFSSEDLMDEVVVLKPETFVNSIFDLIRNARAVRTHSSNSVPPSPSGSVPPSPPNSLPPSPSTPRSSSHSAPPLLSTSNSYPSSPPPLFLNESDAQEPTVQNMAGIFPHSKLKEVWGMDTSYFSDVLALLERSGVLFNFYTSSPGVGKFPMHAKLASHVSYSPSTGYALIPTHLPPAPRSSDLGSLWHPLPEASLAQYGRKYMFELLPRGIFGTLVSRTAQFARMVRCWENSAIFIPDDISSDSNLLSVERVWIRFIPHQRRLDIMSRVPLSSVPTLAHLVIRMAEGFLIDKTSVSVPCSHCARVPDPYSFSLPVLWSGDKVVTCQRNATGPPTHANAAQAQDSASSASGASASAGGSVAVSVRSVLVEVAVLQASNHVIPYNELELDTLPLTGSKRIYLGSYHNQTVVYKLFQPKQSNTVDRKTVLEFCNEVMSLRQLQHPGVIKMHGMCFNPLAIVMECISFVRSSALTLQQFLVDKKQDAEWSKRISIALSIAETMEYFHSLNPQFCHINLRSANILLGKQEDRILVKLTHFGHSGILPIVVPENLPQPAVWCAPEIIQLGQINDKSDVYSFGVVLWELAARAEYLADVKTSDQLLELVNNGQLPNAPTGCPEPLGELIMNCLHRDANKRPSFTSIIASLQQLQGNIVEWNLQQFRGQALMATPPLNWGTELVSLDPSMNAIHKLSIDSVTLEDSLDSVMNDMKGSTFQGLLQHMKNEMSDEVFQFYQQVRLFKQLNMLAPEEQALAKASAKQIWEIYIDNGAPRQINISAPIRESLHGAIFSMLPISANIFQAAEEHVRPLLEDSFRRYKKNHKGYGSVTWERQECGGNIPPPMVGHTVVLHRDKIVVVGGWANNRWSCDTIYKLHRKNFKWCKHTCTGDIPPPSGGAATATIVGNTIMYCCLPNYVYQLFLDTNRWVALKCNIVPASAGFADNLRNSLTPTPPPQDPKDSFNTNANPLQTSTSYPSPTKKLPTFGFLSPRSKKHLVFPS